MMIDDPPDHVVINHPPDDRNFCNLNEPRDSYLKVTPFTVITQSFITFFTSDIYFIQ